MAGAGSAILRSYAERTRLRGPVARRVIEGARAQIVSLVERAYLAHHQGRTVLPHSVFLRYPDHPSRRIIALPAHLDGEFGVSGIKWIASYPENVKAGIPRASAVIVLNDVQTGFPLALIEGAEISAARTAASAALGLATLRPGRREIRRLGVVGAGFIARRVCEFLRDDGWSIGELAICDTDRSAAERFEAMWRSAGGDRVTVDGVEGAIGRSDVVLFATVAGAPHVLDPGLFRHAPTVLHLSLRDLAPEVIVGAVNVVDDVEHALRAGTSLQLAEQATGGRAFVAATLAELLAGEKRLAEGGPRVFSPFGLGVLDLAVAQWVYREADRAGQVVRVDDFY